MTPTHLLIAEAHAERFVRELAEARTKPASALAGGPFEQAEQRIAVIRVHGPLVHRRADAPWLMNYEEISAQVRAAIAARDVAGILLHVDSPGGMVAGVFDLSDLIASARAEKPVVAFVEDHAFSAAYLLASQADEIIATQTGIVGSIGVVMTHFDVSKALESMGVVVTYLHAGARKVDGSPFQPLSAEAREQFMALIDRDYGMFVDHVARGREGKISADEARSTEAGIFTAQAGKDLGLADAIGTRDVAISRLVELIGARSQASTFAVSSMPVVGADVNHPASGGNEEVLMDPKTKSPEGGAAGQVIDLAAENEKLKSALAKSEALANANAASLAAVKAEAKVKVIETAQLDGKVTGTNLAAVTKLAEHMEAKELEAYIAELPVVTHAKAKGVADSKPKASADLAKIAAQAGMTPAQVEAFDQVQTVNLDGTVTLKSGERVLASSINAGRA